MAWLLIPLIFVFVVIGVVALKFLSESRSPFAIIGTLILSIPLLPFWALMWLTTPLWMYSRCPSCHKRKLVMFWSVRSNPPSPSFYKCLACGARFSRLLSGEWQDASSPEYDDRFASNPMERSSESRRRLTMCGR
jgi:DNA-directed RNA polymerase subunit RPC12/RpoP